MSVSMYQSQIKRLDSEIASLEGKIAKEMKTQTKSEKDINSVERSITRNISASSLKQKQNKVTSLRSSIANAQDSIAKLRKTLGARKASLATAQDRLRKEEQKQDDKRRKTELQHERTLTREAEQRQSLRISDMQLGQYVGNVSSEADIEKEYDVFIAHASEDKKDIVEPLARLLRDMGLEVWYDDFVLQLGMSLSQEIDRGIANSRRGIVVLSHAFFAKQWPRHELDGLTTRQMEAGAPPFILPIWHKIEHKDVAKQSPTLAMKYAARTSTMDPEEIAEEVVRVVRGPEVGEVERAVEGQSAEGQPRISSLNDEERALYRGLLNRNRRIYEYWYKISHNYWHDGANAWEETVDPDDVVQNARNAYDYQELVDARNEIEAFAPDQILDLTQSLAEHIRNCQQRILYEVERHGIDDPKQQGPLWREVQVGVRDTFTAQDTQTVYLDLRQSIRQGLIR